MKLESLDLNLLLVFDALATERSVTQAAAKVGLSQPALSNALARLRALFRDPLFERSAGQMQPTPRARQLLVPFSEAISKLREALETQAAFRPDASDREFLIATNDYVDSLLLPRVVQRLQRDAPSIALRTVRTDYLFLPPVERLQSGEIDLALGFFGETPRPNPGLLSRRLLTGRLVCILSTTHPRAGRKLSLRTFVETPHVRVMYPGNGAPGKHRYHPAQSRIITAHRSHGAALPDDPGDRREIELARSRSRGDGPPGSAIAPAQNLRSSHRAPRHHDHDDLERACPIRSRTPLVSRMHRHRERGAHLIIAFSCEKQSRRSLAGNRGRIRLRRKA